MRFPTQIFIQNNSQKPVRFLRIFQCWGRHKKGRPGLTIWLKWLMPRAPRFVGPRASPSFDFLFYSAIHGKIKTRLSQFSGPYKRGAPTSPRPLQLTSVTPLQPRGPYKREAPTTYKREAPEITSAQLAVMSQFP